MQNEGSKIGQKLSGNRNGVITLVMNDFMVLQLWCYDFGSFGLAVLPCKRPQLKVKFTNCSYFQHFVWLHLIYKKKALTFHQDLKIEKIFNFIIVSSTKSSVVDEIAQGNREKRKRSVLYKLVPYLQLTVQWHGFGAVTYRVCWICKYQLTNWPLTTDFC